MLLFWVIVFVMLVATLALILPALLKPSEAVATVANAEKREIYRQQFDEIAQDKANEILDSAQYETAKSELERRMLDEIGTSNESISSSKPDRRLAVLLLVLLPLASIIIYNKIGSPTSVMIPAVAPNSVPEGASAQSTVEHNAMAGDIEPLLEALKSKLEKNPGDGTGWALLARSYVELRRHAEAVTAYEKAVKAIPDDPQLLADYADALAVVNGGNLSGKPEDLANQALKIDPHHVKALLLAATAAYNRKDFKLAITHWEQLQQDLPANSEVLPEVQAALAETYTLAGVAPSKITKKPVGTEEKSVSAGVSGIVKIAPDLADKLDPSATLFVFARAAKGMPMPLAIERATVKDLPYSYHLDDSKSLMPGNKLSQANEVVVVARISKTGDAKPQAGDLQGVSASMKPDGSKVDIEINEVVK